MSNEFNVRNNHSDLCISHLSLTIVFKGISCFSKLQKFNSSKVCAAEHKLLIYGSEKSNKKPKNPMNPVGQHITMAVLKPGSTPEFEAELSAGEM